MDRMDLLSITAHAASPLVSPSLHGRCQVGENSDCIMPAYRYSIACRGPPTHTPPRRPRKNTRRSQRAAGGKHTQGGRAGHRNTQTHAPRPPTRAKPDAHTRDARVNEIAQGIPQTNTFDAHRRGDSQIRSLVFTKCWKSLGDHPN